MADLTEAVRAAIKANDSDVEMVLNGLIIVETLEAGKDNPVLNLLDIGEMSPWLKAGMLRAMVRSVDCQLDGSRKYDEDD